MEAGLCRSSNLLDPGKIFSVRDKIFTARDCFVRAKYSFSFRGKVILHADKIYPFEGRQTKYIDSETGNILILFTGRFHDQPHHSRELGW